MSSSGTAFGEPANKVDAKPFCYAVVDLATAEALRPMVDREHQSIATSLFSYSQPRALLQVGPYLVRLSKVPEIEVFLKNYGENVAWGYYIHSTFDISSLRQSLRYFNLVRLRSNRKEVLFRYWDPRVIEVFFNVATPRQKKRFFDLIERVVIGSKCFDVHGRVLW